MKTKHLLFFLLSFIFGFVSNAQQGINYKAIINDAEGNILANTLVKVKFTILENATTTVYSEIHDTSTDANGILIVNIGEVDPINFNIIDWGSAPHYLKTEIDKGEGFIDMGTTEFKTVPYALYAKTANNSIDFSNFKQGDIPQFNDNNFEPAAFSIYYQDNDGDGYGNINGFVYSPVKPLGFITTGGDTDDNNPEINPDMNEICNDGIDNNSNGQIDENCPIDNDNDGFTIEEGDCDDNDASVFPGAQELCDGIDNDCDGNLGSDEIDGDGDRYVSGVIDVGGWDGPVGMLGGDCDDSDPYIYPGGQLSCGKDGNCDGYIDQEQFFIDVTPSTIYVEDLYYVQFMVEISAVGNYFNDNFLNIYMEDDFGNMLQGSADPINYSGGSWSILVRFEGEIESLGRHIIVVESLCYDIEAIVIAEGIE